MTGNGEFGAQLHTHPTVSAEPRGMRRRTPPSQRVPLPSLISRSLPHLGVVWPVSGHSDGRSRCPFSEQVHLPPPEGHGWSDELEVQVLQVAGPPDAHWLPHKLLVRFGTLLQVPVPFRFTRISITKSPLWPFLISLLVPAPPSLRFVRGSGAFSHVNTPARQKYVAQSVLRTAQPFGSDIDAASRLRKSAYFSSAYLY